MSLSRLGRSQRRDSVASVTTSGVRGLRQGGSADIERPAGLVRILSVSNFRKILAVSRTNLSLRLRLFAGFEPAPCFPALV